VPERTSPAQRAHRREKRRQIYTPVALALAGVALGLILLLALFRAALSAQLSMVADGLLICFTLLPCIVGVLLMFIVTAALALGAGAFNAWLPPRFKPLQDWADRLGMWAANLARAAARLVIGFSVWLARQEHMVRGLGAMLHSDNRRTDERD
jgi:hypothetical protein